MDDKTKQLHERICAVGLEAQRMSGLLSGLAAEAFAIARQITLTDMTVPAPVSGLLETMAQQLGLQLVADLSAADCVTVTAHGGAGAGCRSVGAGRSSHGSR